MPHGNHPDDDYPAAEIPGGGKISGQSPQSGISDIPEKFRWQTAAGTLAVAGAGGGIAYLAGLPLPWLIGAQIALCIVALARFEIFGARPQWPAVTRNLFLPVLGVMVGGSFSTGVFQDMTAWWPSLILLSIFILLVHTIICFGFRRFGGYDFPTAFFASFPGGFIEAAVLGGESGGNQRVILVQHFLRVSLIVFAVPLIFWVNRGEAVGSAAGLAGVQAPAAGPADFAVLAVAGLVGTLISRKLKLPASDISGAMAASAMVHALGWADGSLPPALIAVTQLMIGTSLGVGFAGVSRAEIVRAIGLAIPAFAIVFASAVAIGLLFDDTLGTTTEALILAFTPGGLPEMSLVALSLHLSVPFVALHHLYRILFTMAVLPAVYRAAAKWGKV